VITPANPEEKNADTKITAQPMMDSQ